MLMFYDNAVVGRDYPQNRYVKNEMQKPTLVMQYKQHLIFTSRNVKKTSY